MTERHLEALVASHTRSFRIQRAGSIAPRDPTHSLLGDPRVVDGCRGAQNAVAAGLAYICTSVFAISGVVGSPTSVSFGLGEAVVCR